MSKTQGVFVRLEPEVLEELRARAEEEDRRAGVEPGTPGHKGRAGGVALYLRRLVYEHLGWELPLQFGDKNPELNRKRRAKREGSSPGGYGGPEKP